MRPRSAFTAVLIAQLIGALAFWGGLSYLALHFIFKFW